MKTGSCHCGTVRFEVDGNMQGIFHCHCDTCQKLNGTAYGSTGFVAADDFRVTSGEALLTGYESSPGKQRYFCSVCGAPIYAQAEASADRIGVRIGVIDGDPGVRSKVHIWVSHKQPWQEVATGLPQFDEFAT
jgi:hypothetical protein